MRISDWSSDVCSSDLLDDQAPCVGAALPRAQESRLDDQNRGGADVGGVPDDDRVVAAHFESENPVEARVELAAAGDPGARRSGDTQPVEALLCGQPISRLPPAHHQAPPPSAPATAFDQVTTFCPPRSGLFCSV